MASWQNVSAKKNILSEKRDCVETFHHSLCIIYDGLYWKEQQDWSIQIGEPKQPQSPKLMPPWGTVTPSIITLSI